METRPNDDETEWEAAEWVAKRLGNESFDLDAFDAWVAADQRRGPLFETMWHQIQGPGIDHALLQVDNQERSHRSRIALSLVGVAALVGGFILWPAIEPFTAAVHHYAAPSHQARAIDLADGTRLTLANGSSVDVRLSRYERDVELKHGTMFAKVARDKARPFHVKAGEGSVTVVGTRFEVSLKTSGVYVAVEEGHVRFASDHWLSRPMELRAKQRAALDASGMHRAGDVANGESVASWRRKWVEYHDTPLRQVIKDLQGISTARIVIADDALAALPVTGRIPLSDPEQQIENLSVIHQFGVTRQGGAIILSESSHPAD